MLMNLSPHSLRGLATAAATLALAVAWSPGAHAQRGATMMDLGETARTAASEYWTPERLATARPMLPRVATTPALSSVAPQSRAGAATGAPSQGPERAGLFDEVNLIPGGMRPTAEAASEAAPTAVSPGGYGPFTHSVVWPTSNTGVFPFSTVGKLFFTIPGQGNFVCSASVIRRRVVATAGHCVANPSTTAGGRFFHTNFLFVPGLTSGVGPFGNWTPSTVWVDNRWYHSSGAVPNAGDFGWLVISDRTISGVSRRIGDMTGNLGYRINSLTNNHVTMLGYPCNLDSCNRMQMTMAQYNRDGGTNTAIYPSIMRGGASGGPWIEDFGRAPVGAPAATSGLNRLVGVTSYGPIATTVYYLGSSRMDNTWASILVNQVCAGAPTGSC